MSLGRNYVIALGAVNAETGDGMAREQVEAASKGGADLARRGDAETGWKFMSQCPSKISVPLPRRRRSMRSRPTRRPYEGLEVPASSSARSARSSLSTTFVMAHAFVRRLRQHRVATGAAFSRKAFELRTG